MTTRFDSIDQNSWSFDSINYFYENTYHTIFIRFGKMVLYCWWNFLLWHKIWCIILIKKENIFVEKNASHTFFIYGKCMTSIFLMATTKNFPSNFESAQQLFFVFFFNCKSNLLLNKHFPKKILKLNNLLKKLKLNNLCA